MSKRFPRISLPGPLVLSLRLPPALARLVTLAMAALLTLLISLLIATPMQLLEERVGGQAWVLGADADAEQRVTLVSIDEKSLGALGPWPWPRQVMADLSTALRDAGAGLQIYDVVFPEARPGDEAFNAALQATDAVIAQVPVLGAFQSLQTGQMSHALTGINCSASPVAGNATTSYIANNAAFAGVPAGHITPLIASDGGVRQVPAFICVNGEAYPALALSALLVAAGIDHSAEGWQAGMARGRGLFAPFRVMTLDAYPGLRLPLDRSGNLRIPYHQHPGAFRAVSAVDVINGDFDASLFDGNWALVGATAFGLGDVVPTPYAGAAPGLELQARLLTALLDGRLPYTPRSAGFLLALLSLAAGGVLLGLARLRHRAAMFGLPLAGLLLPLCMLGLHAWLLSAGIWLGWVLPALFVLVAATLLLVLEHHRVRTEHDRVYGNLNSYLPSEVAREIAYSLPTSKVEARRAEVTLMAADLRNFSAYSEARPPEESAALLHRFFVLATEVVESHNGRIHEFKGDGLLAVWGGDRPGAMNALRAARELQQVASRDLLPRRIPIGLEPLGLGIGIEQGSALIGSIGPARRRSYTLLGDTVTIALRIQEMTAELALPVLLGEGVARLLYDQRLESQGRYLLSGLRVPQTLYAPPMGGSGQPESQPGQAALKLVPGGRS
jgi:adenylate cyclase